MRLSPLRRAVLFPLDRKSVNACLHFRKRPVDKVFWEAWRHGLASLPMEQRSGSLAGATGHIAESVIELLLEPYGYVPIHHFVGPGQHGVDLLFLTPDTEAVVGVEVKGTLRGGRWPRLSRTEIQQMSAEWIDKPDNPGMHEWGLGSADVYGAVAQVNFSDMVWRMAFTTDFKELQPVTEEGQIADPVTWLGH
jgi:hypothetical protein